MRTQAPAPIVPKDFEIDWSNAGDTIPGTTDLEPLIILPEPDTSTWSDTVVLSGAATLARAESDVLARVGIQTADSLAKSGEQFYETGTALADVGHTALEAYDRTFRAMPPPSTAIADLRAQIDAEEREDRLVDLTNHRIDPAGDLAVWTAERGFANGSGLPLERTAWSQLAEVAHGQNINAGLTRRSKAERRLRTRLGTDGRRGAFALVSADPKRGYAVLDGPTVGDLVLSGLKDAGHLSGAKAEVQYDRESTRYEIRVILQAPIEIRAFRGVGRVHQLMLRISGGDNGSTSITGALGAMRIRCLNATLTQAEGHRWTRRHVGDVEAIRQDVARMPALFGEVASELQDLWARASGNYFVSPEGGNLDPQEAIVRLVRGGHIPTGGLDHDQAIDAFTQAWRAEDSPMTAAGVVMALQRAAHETTWTTKWAQTEIEDAASTMLYQPVYVLDEVN